MKPATAWAAYRDGRILFESMRGTKGEVLHWCKVLLGINRICTLESLGVEICRITITRGDSNDT